MPRHNHALQAGKRLDFRISLKPCLASLAQIREYFLNELAKPTSEAKGDFVSEKFGSKDT
jgi:hypothetical protein